jgi:hypothetical protein
MPKHRPNWVIDHQPKEAHIKNFYNNSDKVQFFDGFSEISSCPDFYRRSDSFLETEFRFRFIEIDKQDIASH